MDRLKGHHEVHAKIRTPINPETYKPVPPFALYTSEGYHDCGFDTLAEVVAAFVRYGHPVDRRLGQNAAAVDYDGVTVLGWFIRIDEDPVQWFGIPAAAQIFADHPLVDPIEAEVVMMKVKEPA